MFSLNDKTVLVLGLGKTGISIIKFIHKYYENCKIIATDMKSLELLSTDFNEVKKHLFSLTLNGHNREDFENADIIFVSPGVDLNEIPFVSSFSKEIINDIELAYRVSKFKFIGITGSNGKSTTSKLIYEMINDELEQSILCGNYGIAILDEMLKNNNIKNCVCELSSFQLENIIELSPDISLFLNLSEDHLDRYPDFNSYIRAKENIFLNINPGTNIIYNLNDPLVTKIVKDKNCYKYSFSWDKNGDIYSDGKSIFINNKVLGNSVFSLTQCRLRGKHHVENIMAAILAAKIINVDDLKIQNIIETFKGILHRTEFVGTINGVSFYNDSKATNVGACLRAIESFEEDIILIAGGKDKGGDLTLLFEPIKKRVKTLLLIGEATERFYDFFKDSTRCIKCSSLDKAVSKSKSEGAPGDTVLFSPACSSYDMFRNFEERGNTFKKLVLEEV